MTPVHKALHDWKSIPNPAFKKEFVELAFSVAAGESLFRINLQALVVVADHKEVINATKYFATLSNLNPDFVPGDLYNLQKILNQVEQDFVSKVSDVIEKRLSGGPAKR